MGYACPVCEVPQRDGEHLAHHLAFTAMIHGDAHEEWLDERAPGWENSTPTDLADRVAEHATETQYEEVFEDTVHRHDHGRDDATERGPGRVPFDADAARRRGGGGADEATRQVVAEARELTREMLDVDEADDGNGDDGDGGDEDPAAERADVCEGGATGDESDEGDAGGDDAGSTGDPSADGKP